MEFTPAQQMAIRARGNVLVVAGAGTGKTRTLVERCLACLVKEEPRASLDEVLMITFTEAAAAEMRQRIRSRLEQELASHPTDSHWQLQLALFDAAHIGTLHSFCLQLVREHFYELELDPQLKVLSEEEARLLADETLDSVLQAHYAGESPMDEAVRELVYTQGRGWDEPIRKLVLRLHQYSQSLASPGTWLKEQQAMFDRVAPDLWIEWRAAGIADWRQRSLPQLEYLSAENGLAAECLKLLRPFPPNPTRTNSVELLEKIIEVGRNCPRGKQGAWHKPLQNFFEDAAFLHSVAGGEKEKDPLREDWGWVRSQMGTLLQLAEEFARAFAQAKHEAGLLDFQDIEQYTLRLLWDARSGEPTPIAAHWRQKLRFVFVDEYQDINAAQDKIIQGLSRRGAEANRFLVGDVKQSIYRFRLANPAIFQAYASHWAGPEGQIIPLVDNFRSREGLLGFINSLFESLMQAGPGQVAYDEQARLRFGAASERPALSIAAQTSACVELHLRVRGSKTENGSLEPSEGLASLADLEEVEKDARLVGLRLQSLKAQKHPIWDEKAGAFRPVQWSDMAILLRAPARKAESYAKAFALLKIPLQVTRNGFYRTAEVMDLISLLQVLDNPLQDVPVLAVLRSPLVGLTIDELATIRLVNLKSHFWTALLKWHDLNSSQPGSEPSSPPGMRQKLTLLLERFGRWRRLARQGSLSRCLESVLAETHYVDWLLGQPRGEQSQNHIDQLMELAARFDQFQRQGLFRFLKFVEAQQLAEAEPPVAAEDQRDSVRLMSIHQSKGLEFPVVVVPDLNKPFNLADLRAAIILDEHYGLCPQVQPPHTAQRYPSLPYWLARQRQKRELLAEEQRLLYVALTRARDLLILSGSLSGTKLEQLWLTHRENGLEGWLLARSYADWIGQWFSSHLAHLAKDKGSGESLGVRWAFHEDTSLLQPETNAVLSNSESAVNAQEEPRLWQSLRERISWSYPFLAATREAAKTSATALRRKADEPDPEAVAPLLATSQERLQMSRPRSKSGKLQLTAAEIGTAHHTFLQQISLAQTGTLAALQQEASRLQACRALSAEEVSSLNFKGLVDFWQSPLGQRISAHPNRVERELAFTARFSPNELAKLTGRAPEPLPPDEFVVVQGVADLVVFDAAELWLVDFKTDQIELPQLPEKVRLYEPQLRLYAEALRRAYGRPVNQAWLYFLHLSQPVIVPLS